MKVLTCLNLYWYIIVYNSEPTLNGMASSPSPKTVCIARVWADLTVKIEFNVELLFMLRKLQTFIWDIKSKNPSRISTSKKKTQINKMLHVTTQYIRNGLGHEQSSDWPARLSIRIKGVLNIAFIYSFRCSNFILFFCSLKKPFKMYCPCFIGNFFICIFCIGTLIISFYKE